MSEIILGNKYAVSDILVCYEEPDHKIDDKAYQHIKVTYPNGYAAPATYEARPLIPKLEPFVLLVVDSNKNTKKQWYKVLQFSDKGMSVCWIYTYPDSLLSV